MSPIEILTPTSPRCDPFSTLPAPTGSPPTRPRSSTPPRTGSRRAITSSAGRHRSPSRRAGRRRSPPGWRRPPIAFSADGLRTAYDAVKEHRAVDITNINTRSVLAPAVASIPTYVLPPVPADREPTRMVDLIRTEMVDGPTVSFYRTTGPTASSAWLAEGAAKPESALSYTQVTATVHKAPTWVGVSTEALADYSGFAGIVEADLLAGLELFENNQILNGPGTGVTQLGLLNQTGILTLTPGAAQPRILTIRDAITNLRNGAAYAVPDAIIMNPTDVGTTPEYAASTGELVVSPNPTANQPLAFWGVPVLQTSQIAAGTALIGAFAKSTVNYVNEAPTLKVDP